MTFSLTRVFFCLQVWQENELPDVQRVQRDHRDPGRRGSQLRVSAGLQDPVRARREGRLDGGIRDGYGRSGQHPLLLSPCTHAETLPQ